MTTLILFDIDGTLVLTGGAGLRSMRLALEDVFGIPDGFVDVPMAGRTDSWILDETAKRHGLSVGAPARRRFHDSYVDHLAREVHAPGPRKGVLPGVRELLDALSGREDVIPALLTGNFEAGARIKLEYFDLWRYFPYGAFGDHASERNALFGKALSEVHARRGVVVPPQHTVVVGDTPLDVAVAVAGGGRSVAVATGGHTADELRAAGADVVLESLGDLDQVMKALAL